MDIATTLRTSSLFSKFGDNGLALMTKVAEVKSFPAGTPIFVASMLGESLYVIQSGEIALELRMGDRIVPLSLLRPGAHFGQLALLNPGPRLVGAVAHSAATVIEIHRKSFLKLHQVKPQVSLKLMLAICEDLAQATRDIAPLLLRTLAV
ncbi:MAG: cyclic nucleotide-binding domain-containing protein [Pseudomonadota bacterium]